jgi:hypothetical protein
MIAAMVPFFMWLTLIISYDKNMFRTKAMYSSHSLIYDMFVSIIVKIASIKASVESEKVGKEKA